MPTVDELTPAQRAVWDKATAEGRSALAAKYGITAAPLGAPALDPSEVGEAQRRLAAARLSFAGGGAAGEAPAAEAPTMAEMEARRAAPAPGLLPEPSMADRAKAPPAPPVSPQALAIGLPGVPREVSEAVPALPESEWRSRRALLANVAAPAVGVVAAAPAAGMGLTEGAGLAARTLGPLVRGALFATGTEAGDLGLRAVYGDPMPSEEDIAANMAINAAGSLGGEMLGGAIKRVTGMTARGKEIAEGLADVEKAMAVGEPHLERRISDLRDAMISEVAPKSEEAAVRTLRGRAVEVKRKAFADMLNLDRAAADARRAAAGSSEAVDLADATVGRARDLYNLGQHDFGEVFEEARRPFMSHALEDEVCTKLGASIMETVESSKAFAVSPAVRARLRELAEMHPNAAEAADAVTSEAAGLPRGVAEANARAAAARQAAKGAGEVAEEAYAPTVGDLLRIKGELQGSLARGGPDRHVATEALMAINDALAEVGVDGHLPDWAIPKYGNWRNFVRQFSNWRSQMDKGFLRELYAAATPDRMASIFRGERMMAMLEKATPEDKQLLRSAFHDYVVAKMLDSKGQIRSKQIVDLMGTKAMRALYGEGAEDAARWAFVEPALAELEQMFTLDPSLLREYQVSYQRHAIEASKALFEKTQKAIVKQVSEYGPAGVEYAQQLVDMKAPDAVWAYAQTALADPAAFQQAMKEGVLRLPPLSKSGRAVKYGLGGSALAFHGIAAASELATHGAIAPYRLGMLATSAGLTTVGAVGASETIQELRRALIRKLETGGVGSMLTKLTGPKARWEIRALAKAPAQVAAADFVQSVLNSASSEDEASPAQTEPPPLGVMPISAPRAPGAFPEGSAPPTPPPAPMVQQAQNAPQAPPPKPTPQGPPQVANAQTAPQGAPIPPPPAPNPADTELAIHQVELPRFTQVSVGGGVTKEPRIVRAYQGAYDDAVRTKIAKASQTPAYRSATPSGQKAWIRFIMRDARNVALASIRRDLPILLKPEKPEAEAPESLR